MVKQQAPRTDEAAEPAAVAHDEAEAAERYRDRLRAQYGEYGQWVAATDIYHDGALAFAPGHPVPVDHVERYGYDRTDPPLVRRPDGWTEPTDA